MRVKGYLSARGIEFDAIDVTTDQEALRGLLARGIRGLPVVGVGERYILGSDLAQVDDLVGLARGASVTFSQDELADRAIRLLSAASRYARQLPSSHYDHPSPGMEHMKAPFTMPGGHVLVLADGTPYVPHGTYLGLYRHIIGHGAHFQRFVEDPGADYTSLGMYAQFGEPAENLSVEELAALTDEIADAIARWRRDGSAAELERVLDTFAGAQTLRQMLQREMYSLAQHTRQLMHVLMLLGIEPDGPIGEAEYAGLNVPKGVWD